MALWLFRRRSRRKWGRPGSPAYPTSPPLRSLTAPEASAHATTLQHRQSLSRKQRPEPNKLRRRVRGRTYSFESGQADALNLGSASHGHSAAASAAAPQPDARDTMLDRAPTLHHTQTGKRDGHHLLPRTKSSKRRKNAHDRERAAEIKALSHSSNHGATNQFAPLRPAAEPGSAGRPVPDTSTSIDVAMSSDSDDGGAFTISPFAALAPKPTLHYAPQPRAPPSSEGSLPKRLPSKKRMLSTRIPEATLKAHKRIDDLADDMDAGDLRELMERDKRRRERQRLREEERAELRLARLAERQRRLDAQEASGGAGGGDRSGARSSPHLARGVLGRKAVGLGIDSTTSAVITSSTRRQSPPQPIPTPRDSFEQQQTGEPQPPARSSPPPAAAIDNAPNNDNPDNNAERAVENVAAQAGDGSQGLAASISRRTSPVDAFHRPDSAPTEPPVGVQLPADAAEQSTAQGGTAQPINASAVLVRTDSTIRKLMKLRKRLSKSSSLADRFSSNGSFDRSQASAIREMSEDGTPHGRLSWGTLGLLFRWRSRTSKRTSGHAAPLASSFSNVSRGSIMAQPPPKRPYRSPQPLHGAFHAFQVSQTSQVSWVSHASHPSQTSQTHTATTVQNTTGLAHPMRSNNMIPKRALSRFREDLPDYLISPPASRSASPDAERVPPRPPTEEHEEQPTQPAEELERFEATQPALKRSRSLLFDDVEEDYGRDRDNDSIMLAPAVFHPQQQQQATEAVPSSYDGSSNGDNSASNDTRNMSAPWLLMDGTGPSPEPQQSLSLASIDSEGSWLSGRAGGRRRLAQAQRSLDSVSRSDEQQQELFRLQSAANVSIPFLGATPDDEDMAGMLAEDEYLRRYAANPTGLDARLGSNQRNSLGVTRPSSDEGVDLEGVDAADVDMDTDTDDSHGSSSSDGTGDREKARWGTVSKGQVAALVVPGGRASRQVKSHEGLLKNFFEGEAGASGSEDSQSSPISPVSLVSPTSETSQTSSQFEAEKANSVQRATSVNLGRGHVRHISAGSAKLLNISPRNSVDAKAHVQEPLI